MIHSPQAIYLFQLNDFINFILVYISKHECSLFHNSKMVTEYLGFLLNKLNFRKSINIYNFSRFFSHNLKVNTKKPTYLHSKLETFLLPSALIKFLNSQICHQHTSYYFTQSHILTDAYTSHSLKSATLLTQFLKTQKSTTNPEYPQQANPKTSNHVTKVKKKKKHAMP